VDPGDLTGGVFNTANLLQGNNLGRFFNAAQQAIPAVLKGVVFDLTLALRFSIKPLACPNPVGLPNFDHFQPECSQRIPRSQPSSYIINLLDEGALANLEVTVCSLEWSH
jgi:hypothetical protein